MDKTTVSFIVFRFFNFSFLYRYFICAAIVYTVVETFGLFKRFELGNVKRSVKAAVLQFTKCKSRQRTYSILNLVSAVK